MITSSNIVIVMLRQPNRNDPNEKRSDPFWEYGSFGCTGCHRSNLLNPRRANELEGMRLAFAQGGRDGIKLVYLTPPISVARHSIGCELKWSPHEMPLKYSAAPIIINNDELSDISAILREIRGVGRSTPVGKFASKFRSRRRPLDTELARQLEVAYRRNRRRKGAIAKSYEEALPYAPPKSDRQRDKTYRELVERLKEFPTRSVARMTKQQA